MIKTEIKICGLSTEKTVASVIKSGADYMGLIFFEKSPRNVSISTAKDLSRFAGSSIKKVVVTVNASEGFLDRIVEAVQPDLIQFHGSESVERCREVKQRYNVSIMKAFAIRSKLDLSKTNAFIAEVDKILFDAKAPKNSDLPGGNGVSFDWKILSDFVSKQPYMLSGGIDPFNVRQALEISGAKAIDISSGVESSPGVKDIDKIKSFIKAVRDHDAEVVNR